MKCPVCGTDNEPAAAFCYQCGSALQPAGAATGATVHLGRQETSRASSARVYDVPADDPGDRPWSSLGDPQPPAATPARVYQVPQGAPYAASPMQPARTSSLAIIALVLGIVSFMFLPLIGGIGAIITGNMARREIRTAGGQVGGDGLALAGLILGVINVAVTLLGCCVFAVPLLTLVGIGG